MTLEVVAWWALTLGGWIPATWFLVRFRPRWPIRPASLVILGFVGFAWVLGSRSLISVAIHDWTVTFTGTADMLNRLGTTVVADALLIGTLALFLRIRRDWPDDRTGLRPDDDQPPEEP